MKKENETFNDVVKDLLNERTKAVGDDNVKAINYKRKTAFLTLAFGEEIGIEYEYNDVKDNKDDFVLDLKIKKVFFRKRSLNPSEFFGVDNDHKHYFSFFLYTYFEAVTKALLKEFHAYTGGMYYFSITNWKQLYHEYMLSEESFENDIEEPLMLSEEEKVPKSWLEQINNSPAKKFIDEKGVAIQ